MVDTSPENGNDIPPRPELVDVRQENIPLELKRLDQWVMWRWLWRDGKWTKPPHQTDGQYADTTDPKTWGSFADCYSAYKFGEWEFHGIGFVFTADDPFRGVDLDDCYNDLGQLVPWRQRHPRWDAAAPDPQKIVEGLHSYYEVSPSGGGVKIIIRGQAPKCGKRGDFEVYDRDRYFTITGQVLEQLPIERRQKNVERLCELFLPGTATDTSNTEEPQAARGAASMPCAERVLEMALRSGNGQRIRKLFVGDWQDDYSSQSEADLALCSLLAFWSAGDPAVVDTLFRRSELMREKWDTPRGDSTYGRQTIAKALAGCTEFYCWGQPEQEQPAADTGEWVFDDFWCRLSDIAEQPINWVWRGYLPRGMVSWFVGDSTRGKSWAALDLMARITNGQPMPDGAECQRGQVLFSTREDSISRTIKQRSRWLGISEPQVIVPKQSLYLDKNLSELRSLLANEPISVAVFDTFTAHISGAVDMASNNDSREKVLTPLYELSEEFDTAVLMIDHPPKASYKHGPHNVLGSVAFGGAARGVWEARSGPNNTTLLSPSKMSVGPPMPELAYRLESADDGSCGVRWVNAADTKEAAAEELILEVLVGEEEMPWAEIEKAGADEDISRPTMFRAHDKLLLGKKIRKVRRGVFTTNTAS